MSNPALSQAQFNYIGERLFYLLSKYMTVRELRYRFERTEVRIQEENDTLSSTSSWSLTGVEIGVNTDANGLIYVRITDENPGAGQALVDLYKATGAGGGDKIATGSAADGATVTLAAANSSGVTGTVVLGTVGANETNDLHRLRCYVDYPIRDVHVFDGTEADDYTIRERLLTTNKSVVTDLKAAEARIAADINYLLAEYVADRINSGGTTGLVKGFTRDAGAVSLVVTGILEDLRDAMDDNTTVQYILRNVVSLGSASFDGDNVGLGSVTSPTAYEKILPGTITFRCTSEIIGAEEFSVTLVRSDTGEKVRAQAPLRVKREFKDANIGIRSLTLARTFTKTNDGSNLHLAAIGASFSVDGENSRNTNAGTLYWYIRANSSNWDIEFYKASTLQSGDLVAKATNVATGAVFQATAQNSSGLTVNGTVGSAPVATTTGNFLLNPFKAGPPADMFTIAVTRTSYGEIQRLLSELAEVSLDWYLNSAASGSVTLADNLLTRGGPAIYGRN